MVSFLLFLPFSAVVIPIVLLFLISYVPNWSLFVQFCQRIILLSETGKWLIIGFFYFNTTFIPSSWWVLIAIRIYPSFFALYGSYICDCPRCTVRIDLTVYCSCNQRIWRRKKRKRFLSSVQKHSTEYRVQEYVSLSYHSQVSIHVANRNVLDCSWVLVFYLS